MPIPPRALPGFLIAFVTCVAAGVLGLGWYAVCAVLVVWVGTLWLAASAPPPPAPPARDPALARENVGSLVEHASTPIIVTEGARVTVANRAARRLLGAHIVGQDARVALRQPEAVRLLDATGDANTVVRGLARRRDIWRLSRKQVGPDLAVIEFVNRTAEADISRAHTDFVANASHELRTPLAAIIGYVETLRDEGAGADPDTSARFLDIIAREAGRLETLVHDLMSLSRIEAEKHEVPDTPCDLTALVRRAARDGAGSRRLDRLALDLDDGIAVCGDLQQLEQLVRNLVDNGLKYGADGGAVDVSLAADGPDRARLTVRDRGDGIAPEHLPHLTRRFYRTDPGRSRAGGGTGLGLAIVKHIVERHRGQLDIVSAPGDGTTVAVSLPRLRREAASDEAA